MEAKMTIVAVMALVLAVALAAAPARACSNEKLDALGEEAKEVQRALRFAFTPEAVNRAEARIKEVSVELERCTAEREDGNYEDSENNGESD